MRSARPRAEFSALADDARCAGTVQLQPAETATCVRVTGGRTLMTDGPFADTKEVLGGVYLIELRPGGNGPTERRASRLGAAVSVFE